MISLGALTRTLDENKDESPDFLKQMLKERQCRDYVKSTDEFSRREWQTYTDLVEAHRTRHFREDMWTKMLGKLIAYSQPHFASVATVQQVPAKDLYIAASFVGSGRQDYMVQHKSKFYFHQTVVDYRKEPIMFPQLQASAKQHQERNPNVFKDWQADTQQLIDRCCKFDTEFWKVKNFIKDPKEEKKVARVIRENFLYLKDLYAQIGAKSSYPCVSQLETGVVIQETGLLDAKFTQGIMDTQFIASRVDVEKRNNKIPGQNILDCNRFEFFEFLVRIANAKFKQVGLCDSVDEALKMLIDMLIREQALHESAQEFRETQLWTREVNLTLDANLKSINKLYNHCAKTKVRKVSVSEAMHLMTSVTGLQDNTARACFAMSQQTTADIVKHGFLRMQHMEKLEFLEMIGRAADAYCTEDLPLYEKINKLLDLWLPLVGCERKEPKYFVESDDSSD